MLNLAWLIAVFPLVAFIANATLGERLFKRVYHLISIIAVSLSFILSTIILFQLNHGQLINQKLYDWIFAGSFKVSIGFMVDSLTALMMVVVTFVSMLVHIYSVGYMHGERGRPRYFSFLSLFTFSMLMLVLANNFLQLYVFWEAVGLCSYLLIGFWYEKKSAADAGKKAFIVNRIGDFGFAIGVMLIFFVFRDLDFQTVFNSLDGISATMLTTITLLLFVGAIGKSAQFPLHVWLPDAMEGPTPVSALIHAATMVTAGVYMVARLNPMYGQSPDTLTVIMYIGAFTAIFAASIGLVQNDIKKVLAYSTISQLGYMFLALGVGAYVAAIFHLMTHAFFKALLFLGSGVVVHKVHTMDMKEMGGLYSKIKITAISFIIASLALAGIPPFSGFWSKEMILGSVYEIDKFVFWIGIIAAFMTAFYISRACYLTFFGKPFKEHHLENNEKPDVMNIPVLILAVFAIISGFVGASLIKNAEGLTYIDSFLEPVFTSANGIAEHEGGAIVFLASFGAALFGFFMATIMYLVKVIDPDKLAERIKPIYLLLFNKYYIDEIYHNLIVRPVIGISRISLWSDLSVIDGLVNGVAAFFKELGFLSRRFQSGNVQRYLALMATGLVVIIFFYLIR